MQDKFVITRRDFVRGTVGAVASAPALGAAHPEPAADAWAQAKRPIPCLGTTHADHFYGTVPCTRPLTADEINTEYELNTGKVIVERFRSGKLDPDAVPAVLVASHAPFVWGASAQKALENAIALEAVAGMQLGVYQLNASIQAVPQVLLDKHYKRKHGPGAYYGQAGAK